MRLLLNHSDTNPTNLRHPANTTCGAEWTATAPIQSSLSTASRFWWWTLLSITVRSGDTNSKDVNGACDKKTHHATLAHKNSVGDGKPRQVVNTNHAVSNTNDTKPLKPCEHDERVSKQIHQRERENAKMHVHCQQKSTQH